MDEVLNEKKFINSMNLKISKTMAKYSLKTLYISIYGGNITLMMINDSILKMIIIKWIQLINHHQRNKTIRQVDPSR